MLKEEIFITCVYSFKTLLKMIIIIPFNIIIKLFLINLYNYINLNSYNANINIMLKFLN